MCALIIVNVVNHRPTFSVTVTLLSCICFVFAMSYNYSNFTQFGIEDNGERYGWASWLVFVIISSLLGDTTILIGSIKYKAFRLHKIIVTFIQHLAVCDLFITVGTLVHTLVHLISNSGGSSKIIQHLQFFIIYHSHSVSSTLVSAMALSKLVLLKYPLRTGSWSARQAHKFCAGIWIACISVPALPLFVDRNDIIFDYRVYAYTYKFSSDLWKILLPIFAALTLFLPNIILIVSTVLLLKEAMRVAKGAHQPLRWQGITTVLLTATVHIVSFAPLTVYHIAEPFLEKKPFAPGPFYFKFYRISGAILDVSVLANFFVYSLTVTSFRSFLKKRFSKTISFLSSTKICQGN